MQHDKRDESWLITAATWITIIIVVLEAILQVVEQFTVNETDGVAEQENERGEEQQNKEVTNI